MKVPYYSLYFKGSRIACFWNCGDMLDYIERSVLAGCSRDGWAVRYPDGKFMYFACGVRVYAVKKPKRR